MPARKPAKKGAAKKSAAKSRKGGITAAKSKLLTQNVIEAILKRREWVMYAQPIKDITVSGNLAQMRQAASLTRKHLADVQKSLGKLDAKIRAGGR
jgi:hypothetical protein